MIEIISQYPMVFTTATPHTHTCRFNAIGTYIDSEFLDAGLAECAGSEIRSSTAKKKSVFAIYSGLNAFPLFVKWASKGGDTYQDPWNKFAVGWTRSVNLDVHKILQL